MEKHGNIAETAYFSVKSFHGFPADPEKCYLNDVNTEEQDIDVQEQDSIRIARFRAFYESIMAPKDVVPELYFDRNLSRSEFDAKVLEVGYQVALRKLAVEACNGDTKALDLFLKRCDSYFEEKRVKVKVEDATPALSSLVQPARLPSK